MTSKVVLLYQSTVNETLGVLANKDVAGAEETRSCCDDVLQSISRSMLTLEVSRGGKGNAGIGAAAAPRQR